MTFATYEPLRLPIAPPTRKIDTINDHSTSIPLDDNSMPYFEISVFSAHSVMYFAGALITPILYPATIADPTVVANPVTASALLHPRVCKRTINLIEYDMP